MKLIVENIHGSLYCYFEDDEHFEKIEKNRRIGNSRLYKKDLDQECQVPRGCHVVVDLGEGWSCESPYDAAIEVLTKHGCILGRSSTGLPTLTKEGTIALAKLLGEKDDQVHVSWDRTSSDRGSG